MCSSWGAFCDRNETRLICLSHVPSRSDAVISWASKLLPQSLFVLYEQMHPGDPFGRVMQNHFLKLNSTLHGLRRYPDAAAQRRRFLEQASARVTTCARLGVVSVYASVALRCGPCLQGWEQCVCLDMNHFYLGMVPEEERRRVESLEPFDEYEVSLPKASSLIEGRLVVPLSSSW